MHVFNVLTSSLGIAVICWITWSTSICPLWRCRKVSILVLVIIPNDYHLFYLGPKLGLEFFPVWSQGWRNLRALVLGMLMLCSAVCQAGGLQCRWHGAGGLCGVGYSCPPREQDPLPGYRGPGSCCTKVAITIYYTVITPPPIGGVLYLVQHCVIHNITSITCCS